MYELEWVEGKVYPITHGSYRHRLVVHCHSRGRQEAQFANGRHPYFGYMEFADGEGRWRPRGANMVPVLPNGNVLMVVEQRAPQQRFPNRSMIARIMGSYVDLRDLGEGSSLECPGGMVEVGEDPNLALGREMIEETGIRGQKAIRYTQCEPVCAFGSDVAHQLHLAVFFLTNPAFERHTSGDGGLVVFELTPEDVEHNLRKVVIHSGQAGRLPLMLWRDVVRARREPDYHQLCLDDGYFRVEEVQL